MKKVDLIVRAHRGDDGRWDSEFPLVVFSDGSGNARQHDANEVIANRAMQLPSAQFGSKKPISSERRCEPSQSQRYFPTAMAHRSVETIENGCFSPPPPPAVGVLTPRRTRRESRNYRDVDGGEGRTSDARATLGQYLMFGLRT